MVNGLPDATRVVFDDERAVANAGVLLPAVLADVREGRYVETVARANRVLGSGQLTRPQLALLYRALLEAYIALDAPLEAKEACVSLRANARDLKLDPTTTSPKIRAACGK